MHKPLGWRYQYLDPRRSALLMRKTPLEQLVAEVVAGVEIQNLKLKEPCSEAKRKGLAAHRVSFRLRPVVGVASDAADALLNGAYGLRAHYCRSAQEGNDANGLVLRLLAEAIRARTIPASEDIPEQYLIALPDALGESLAKESAKVWFDPDTDRRPAWAEDGEVFSDIWIKNREVPEQVESTLQEVLSLQQIEWSLTKGRSLPRPLALEVKAPFIDSNGFEYVPDSKKGRSQQIHLMGWT